MKCEKCRDTGVINAIWQGSYRIFCDCKVGKETLAKWSGREVESAEVQLPEVGGRTLPTSLGEFERSCQVEISILLKDANANSRLISVLSNAIRLARECIDAKGKIPCQCQVYEQCDKCRLKTPSKEPHDFDSSEDRDNAAFDLKLNEALYE